MAGIAYIFRSAKTWQKCIVRQSPLRDRRTDLWKVMVTLWISESLIGINLVCATQKLLQSYAVDGYGRKIAKQFQ